MPIALITTRTLSRLKRVYDSALSDTCQQMTYNEPTANIYGTGDPTYAAGSILRCLVRPDESPEVFGSGTDGTQVEDVRAVIRFARTAEISHLDRIKLISIQGGVVPTGTYEIVAGPVLDQVHYRAILKLVTDGSDA